MNDPLVGITVQCCRGLKVAQVGSVTKFRLGVASNDLVLLSQGAPVLGLLLRSLCINNGNKSGLVQAGLQER